jgi:hypothetical protein
MGGLFPMIKGVSAVVAATANRAADQTGPEIPIGVADTALGRFLITICRGIPLAKVVLRVPTDRTPAAFPFLETSAVEDVLTDDCEKACCLIHSFETYGAGGKFDQCGCRWCERFCRECSLTSRWHRMFMRGRKDNSVGRRRRIRFDNLNLDRFHENHMAGLRLVEEKQLAL